MKKLFFGVSLLLMLFCGCQDRQVQLPIIEIAGITEIQNHSSIWIFYEKQNGDQRAVLNKNNKILNTHWIFNIDKRLTMKHLAPHLIAMQEDRNKDSMHKKEGMLNYFSYADTSLNQISLIPFLPVAFTGEEDEFDNQEVSEDTYLTIENTYTSIVEINNDFIKLNDKIVELQDLKAALDALQKDNNAGNSLVRLMYQEDTEFQSYLQTKVYLSAQSIPTMPLEYMFRIN